MPSLEQRLRSIERRLDRIGSRIASLAARGIVQTADDSGERQAANVDVFADDSVGMEVFEPYGLTAALPSGSAGVAVSIGGDTGHAALLCAAPRGDRPTQRVAGEVTLWSIHGQRIDLKSDGRVIIAQSDDAGSSRITIKASGDILIETDGVVALDSERVALGSDGGVVNKAVGRVGDRVSASTAMDAWAAAVEAGISSAGGTPPPVLFEAAASGSLGEIADGSSVVDSA